MQKSIHRRRGNTMRNVHISDPFSCCSCRQKFLRAPRSLRIQCSKFCFGNGQEKFFYQGLGGIPRRLWVFDCAQHASHTMAQVTAAIRQDIHCNCSLTGCYSKASMFPSGSAPRKPLVHCLLSLLFCSKACCSAHARTSASDAAAAMTRHRGTIDHHGLRYVESHVSVQCLLFGVRYMKNPCRSTSVCQGVAMCACVCASVCVCLSEYTRNIWRHD